MGDHVFVGFGFGPIQSALFVSEAYKSGNFKRIVIAEVDQSLVDKIRANNGKYYVNVAKADSIVVEEIDGIEIYNPLNELDKIKLLEALSQATEIVTSLPSVDFYDKGSASVAKLIAGGLNKSSANGTIIYTAENNNHAAEILAGDVSHYIEANDQKVQFLNTVIGKMSQVTTDLELIDKNSLKTIVPGFQKAFLVEEFNKILVTKTNIEGFKPGIEVFIEKEDLLPFEEAKLYGHNAIHALLAFLAKEKNYETMDQLRNDNELMEIAYKAFVEESGAALVKKYQFLNDDLFTESGFKAYAEDLLVRMTNPYLADAVDRAARDPLRKLGVNDRIFGTMLLALEHGVKPENMARGARAGIKTIKEINAKEMPKCLLDCNSKYSKSDITQVLNWLWKDHKCQHFDSVVDLVAC